jgi:hypothetical protein
MTVATLDRTRAHVPILGAKNGGAIRAFQRSGFGHDKNLLRGLKQAQAYWASFVAIMSDLS